MTIELLRQATDQVITTVRTNALRQERELERNYAALVRCTKRYHETGIGLATREAEAAIRMVYPRPKEYFKAVASALNRPVLHASTENTYQWTVKSYVNLIRLKIPRSKPFENLAGGLLLISTEYQHGTMPALAHVHDARNWTFLFNGKEGREHFLRFMQMCRTNPLARIALKLPVILPTE